jgi:coproporphyrinogen III oxidase
MVMAKHRTKQYLTDNQETVLAQIKQHRVNVYWHKDRWYASSRDGEVIRWNAIEVLKRLGYVEVSYYTGLKAGVSCTDAGREYAPRVRAATVAERHYFDLGLGG